MEIFLLFYSSYHSLILGRLFHDASTCLEETVKRLSFENILLKTLFYSWKMVSGSLGVLIWIIKITAPSEARFGQVFYGLH